MSWANMCSYIACVLENYVECSGNCMVCAYGVALFFMDPWGLTINCDDGDDDDGQHQQLRFSKLIN